MRCSKLVSLVLLLFCCWFFIKCAEGNGSPSLWRGAIALREGKECSFIFELDLHERSWVVHNADERLDIAVVRTEKDSIFIASTVFNTEIRAKFSENRKLMTGYFYNNDHQTKQAFDASFGKSSRFDLSKFETPEKSRPSDRTVDGVWQARMEQSRSGETHFVDMEGEFQTLSEGIIKATFLAPTGDSRYMEGYLYGSKFVISAFDWKHVYYYEFDVDFEKASMYGRLYSGKYSIYEINAWRGEPRQVFDPETLTVLKDGYESVSFAFPPLKEGSGEVVFPSDKYRSKVVILQIMGSWCPNCMDETKYFEQIYRKYKSKGLAIVGLSYEFYASDLKGARELLQKQVKALDATYDFSIALYGRGKTPEETLPMLNHVMAYPTSIYLDRKGRVRKIHTGFYGPSTSKYAQYVQKNDVFIEELLSEK